MKKIIVLMALVATSVARADGYLGLDYANARISVDCAPGQSCSQKRSGFNFRWGTALPEAYSLKVDNFSVDTVEAGWIKTGRLESTGVVPIYVRTGNTAVLTTAPVASELSARAVYAALIGRYAFDRDLSAYARLGLAYVSTTMSLQRSGLDIGGVSENHWSPLLGLGAEYAVMPGLKLQAGVQLFKIKTTTVSDPGPVGTAGTSSVSGTVRELTLGGQYEF